MSDSLSTISFRANSEGIEASRLVFSEHGLTLEEGMDLFLRHAAETKSLPEFKSNNTN